MIENKIGINIIIKLLFRLNEKNLVEISEQVIKMIPNIKIFILNLEYPAEFLD